ncbi:hypothetical protein [Halalkalirubrum salinum]|uniref:hypothetical protein n=1 Tax=Halalkalirubrum salinum TaxID=2563889 RepID=UPI0010FB5C2C|nr:hypothetical protein [Halalkalirubrum salinum]
MENVGSGDGDAIAKALEMGVAYYIYFMALLDAADVLGIPQLTELLSDLATFLLIVLAALVVLVVGFDIAIATNLFTAFIAAFFGALALAVAIGIGVAVGLGGRDYVAENIDEWVDSAVSAIKEDNVPEME